MSINKRFTGHCGFSGEIPWQFAMVYGIAGFEMTEEKDMAKVTFDYSKASKFISDDEVVAMKKIAEDAKEVLVNKSGAGNDFLGWIVYL